MIDPYGGLWRTRAAVTDAWAMPQRRTWLAPGQMASLQDRSPHPARLRPAAEGNTHLET
jgi:hypothetical protein